jgi:hypothetical protein
MSLNEEAIELVHVPEVVRTNDQWLPSDEEKAELNILLNSTVGSYCWNHCSVEVKDRKTGPQKLILDNVSGLAKAGQRHHHLDSE